MIEVFSLALFLIKYKNKLFMSADRKSNLREFFKFLRHYLERLNKSQKNVNQICSKL